MKEGRGGRTEESMKRRKEGRRRWKMEGQDQGRKEGRPAGREAVGEGRQVEKDRGMEGRRRRGAGEDHLRCGTDCEGPLSVEAVWEV